MNPLNVIELAKPCFKFLSSFLTRHQNLDLGLICEQSARTKYLRHDIEALSWSEFQAFDDSFVFSDLVSQAIKVFPPSEVRLLELGIGSGIPLIRAICQSPEHSIKVTGVDCSSRALQCCEKNWSAVEHCGKPVLLRMDMIEFIKSEDLNHFDLIVANPPYVPTPSSFIDPSRHTFDGGLFGDYFLRRILHQTSLVNNVIIALQWSSLSNPERIISLIEEKFEVLSLKTHWTPFGRITSKPKIKEYLNSLNHVGKSFHTQDGKYLFMSIILRSRQDFPRFWK